MIEGVNMMGGIYMFGHYLPIWSVILIEIGVAFVLDMLIGGPLIYGGSDHLLYCSYHVSDDELPGRRFLLPVL